MPPTSTQANSPQTLLSLRIIWLALLFGPLAFLMVVAFVVIPTRSDRGVQPVLTWVCAGMLVIELPMVFAIRSMIFRRGRVNGRLTLRRYTTGNIVFWAGCEGVAFFGIVTAMINHRILPTLPIIVIALILQALTFPIGTNVLLPGEETA